MNNKSNKTTFDKLCLYFWAVLIIQFLVRIAIYLNTTLFAFTDFKSYIDAIEVIHKTGYFPLLGNNFMYANSYVGYFFKYQLGNLGYYFVFNCLLGTLTTMFISLIVYEISQNKKLLWITALVLSLYPEFMIFSSVFYTMISMACILSAVVLMIIKLIKAEKMQPLYIALILVLTPLSMLLKSELKYFGYLLFLVAIFGVKEIPKKVVFILMGILIILSTNYVSHNLRNTKYIVSNQFIFFGHTWYGGDGGEGYFIYPENEARYIKAYNQYLTEKGYKPDELEKTRKNRKIQNEFQMSEIKKQIRTKPLSWVWLQAVKFYRTFGILPEGNSFKILQTGKMSMPKLLIAFLLVFPIALLCFITILVFDKIDYKNKLILFLLFCLGYYLAAIVLYGQYQERYRLPAVAVFIIPLVMISLESAQFSLRNIVSTHRLLKAVIALTFIAMWLFQAYIVLWLHPERFLGNNDKWALNQTERYNTHLLS